MGKSITLFERLTLGGIIGIGLIHGCDRMIKFEEQYQTEINQNLKEGNLHHEANIALGQCITYGLDRPLSIPHYIDLSTYEGDQHDFHFRGRNVPDYIVKEGDNLPSITNQIKDCIYFEMLNNHVDNQDVVDFKIDIELYDNNNNHISNDYQLNPDMKLNIKLPRSI